VAGVRTLVVWCPDWPVVAAGAAPDAAVAVVAANRVVACSTVARADGVRRGLRRREAQGRCPTLEVVEADPERDARAFEPVAVAVEAFTPGIEIIRPGVIALSTRGPSRYFGGDGALAEKIAGAVDKVTAAVVDPTVGGPAGCRVGVADGRFAAEQAARSSGAGQIMVVDAGASRRFVAPLPVSTLPYPDLVSLLVRLGLRTLEDLAAVPAPSVLARFGPDGAEAQRLARGLDPRPLAARVPPPDLAVSAVLDPPAERVDTAAFVAKALAAELHARLGALGLGCTRVAIEAETEHGEHLVRLWRHAGTLTAGAIAERVRWQLDGWLSRGETSGGLTLLRLVPDEVRPDGGRQVGFWGGATDDDGVARTLARVQGILGPEGVVTAVVGGGRGPAEQVRLVPWGEPREPSLPGGPPPARHPVAGDLAVGDPAVVDPAVGETAVGETAVGETAVGETAVGEMAVGMLSAPVLPRPRRPGARGRRSSGVEIPPWPGRLPGPAPAVVHPEPLAAQVRDAAGDPVTVSGRGVVSQEPAAMSIAGGPWQPVEAWAGPWPVEERWWEAGRRRARVQVTVAGGAAHLLARETGRWWVEATYD
jgi:protein ImuB